jgi:transposase
MKRFVEGVDGAQSTLFPECLDDWIDEDNPVRVVDAFVDAIDVGEIGFDGVAPDATGRPAYHPAVRFPNRLFRGEPGARRSVTGGRG